MFKANQNKPLSAIAEKKYTFKGTSQSFVATNKT